MTLKVELEGSGRDVRLVLPTFSSYYMLRMIFLSNEVEKYGINEE